MCGLYGAFSYLPSAPPIREEELTHCRDMMENRGPDGKGLWLSPDARVGLAHRRLSIIDLEERANQPLSSSDGRYIIVFNGEIYNYQELRSPLIEQGVTFNTQSDTEVLLELYRREGKDMLRKLRGMFSLALFDTVEKKLLLARDPYGIKPLYISNEKGTLRFCSQVKPIIGSGAIDTRPDSAGWVSFFMFGSVKEPFTTYQSVKSLPAGHYIEASSKGSLSTPKPYLQIKDFYAQPSEVSISDAERQNIIRSAVLDSVKAHLVADVPIGLFLSAGIDSSSLLGLMQDAGQSQIKTVTLAFEEFKGQPRDEGALAKEIAEHYDVEHHLRYISESEFKDDIPRIFSSMDLPSIDGINTYFASKAAAEAGLKVVISGVGGDELLGGYQSFKTIPQYKRTIGAMHQLPGLPFSLSRIAKLAHKVAPARVPKKLSGLLEQGYDWPGAYIAERGIYLFNEIDQIFDPEFVRNGLEKLGLRTEMNTLISGLDTDHSIISILESSYYMRNQLLRDSDWASMAHSLELRTPLVDKNLLETIAPIAESRDTNNPKSVLANSPLKPLPDHIANRKKTGFSIPVDKWLMQDMRFSHWKSQPRLNEKNCPWARRWAYEIAHETKADLPLL